MFPTLIPKVAFIHDATDSYLNRGADLYMKGVMNNEELKKASFKIGDTFIVQTVSG